MVLLIVAVYWCRGNRYIPSECTFFRILTRYRAQNTIQCHDNNIWKQMCIKELSYSTETYLQFQLTKENKQVEKYMWAPHHKLVLFLQIRNCFHYVRENNIEGYILGWTTSSRIRTQSRLQMLYLQGFPLTCQILLCQRLINHSDTPLDLNPDFWDSQSIPDRPRSVLRGISNHRRTS